MNKEEQIMKEPKFMILSLLLLLLIDNYSHLISCLNYISEIGICQSPF